MRIFNTQNLKLIRKVCTKVVNDKSITFIIGASGAGKTIALSEFCKDRNDTMIMSGKLNKKLIVPDWISLIVIDGPKTDWQSLYNVRLLIQQNENVGFVIAINTIPFLSQQDSVREKAFDIVKCRAEIVEIIGDGPPYDFRTRIKLAGVTKPFKGNANFVKHFVVSPTLRHSGIPVLSPAQASSDQLQMLMLNYKRPLGLNVIHNLKRPSLGDVKGICERYGVAGSNAIHQQSNTINEVLKFIQCKQLRKAN